LSKKLFHAKVRNFVPYGGKVKDYWIYAWSFKQAKFLVSRRFNKKFGFVPNSYVDMEIEEIKKKKEKNS